MKKLPLILGIVLLYTVSIAQTPFYFHNYKGERVYLSLNTKYAFLSVRDQQLPTAIQRHNVRAVEFQSDRSDRKQFQGRAGASRYFTVLDFEEAMSDEQYLALLSDMRRENNNVIIAPFFRGANENDVIAMSNFFYVKLKEKEDTTLLRQMAERTGSVIIEQDPFMPLWYVLSVAEFSEFNAMESANLFFESGLFQTAEPDLIFNLLQCANDQRFGQQWGLKNTADNGGATGIDIRICDAWVISTGANVRVAVIDHGIEKNHPDLHTNVLQNSSWDTENRSFPSRVLGDHGVPVAGIIGAIRNNGIGIAGVAPESKLISISDRLTAFPFHPNFNVLQQQNLAAGINWAWEKAGADVINNSWGNHLYQGSLVENAISNAVTFGRNGKGTVVIFASGNDNISSVDYPANLPNVIAVGAIDHNGQRVDLYGDWGSNYGQNLDVVAPGTSIPTLGIGGSLERTFEGTSAAAPHVAGIAALILSVRPDLSVWQVRNAIESTARKLPGYSFNANRWNNEVGYGLVDAYRAVKHAMFDGVIPTITGQTSILCGTATFNMTNTSFPVTSWSVTVGFTITDSNATSATVKATDSLNGQKGTLTAMVNGVKIIKDIQACNWNAAISGLPHICNTGIYQLNDNHQATGVFRQTPVFPLLVMLPILIP